MTSKTDKKTNTKKPTNKLRITLIVSAAIMVLYVALAYFVTNGSFWDFATIHMILAVVALLFIWSGERTPRAVLYIAVGLSILGAVTAALITAYYLFIIAALASA